MEGRLRHVDQGANRGIGGDAEQQRQRAQQGVGLEQRGGNAADEADEGADGEIEVIDGDDEHLGDGGKRDRHGVLQHQVQAEIAHGAGLHIEGCAQHDHEGNDGQQ